VGLHGFCGKSVFENHVAILIKCIQDFGDCSLCRVADSSI